MKKVHFDDIKHLIPENCPYNHEDFRSPILYAEGNQTWIEPTDLDEIYGMDDTEDFYPFVLINGDLTASQIFNEETDGSTGLIVLGNLRAENIVVGGQGIYVAGDMTVNGLYWGDYNHGELIVEGYIRARAFINTDYGVDFTRFRSKDRMQIDHFLWDEAGDYDDVDRLKTFLKPAFILNDMELSEEEMYSWKEWINDAKLFEALRENMSLLLPLSEIQIPRPDYPFLFADERISAENLNRLTDKKLFVLEAPQDGPELNFEYWQDEVFKRISYVEEKPMSPVAYFQHDEDYACMVYYGYEPSLLDKFGGKRKYQLAISYRPSLDDQQQWVKLDQRAPKIYHDFLETQWKNLLHELSEMLYLQKQYDSMVTIERFDEIMSLPIVQYTGKKYYSEADDSYIPFRGVEWQFRNASAAKEKEARITIAKFIGEDDEGEDLYEFYHFQKEVTEENDGVRIVLYTQDENDFSSDIYELTVSELAKFKKALQHFELLDKHIEKKNEGVRKF